MSMPCISSCVYTCYGPFPHPHFSTVIFFSAESTGAVAQSVGGYLDHLASGSALSGGAGIGDYLSSVSSASAINGSASAVKVSCRESFQ